MLFSASKLLIRAVPLERFWGYLSFFREPMVRYSCTLPCSSRESLAGSAWSRAHPHWVVPICREHGACLLLEQGQSTLVTFQKGSVACLQLLIPRCETDYPRGALSRPHDTCRQRCGPHQPPCTEAAALGWWQSAVPSLLARLSFTNGGHCCHRGGIGISEVQPWWQVAWMLL